MGAQPQGTSWPPDGALDPALVEPDSGRRLAAYVHVPFCTVRCGYCDFNTYTKDFGPGADRASYVDTVLREIGLSRRVLDDAGLPERPLQSVFFGGGTPSLLDPSAIGAVIGALDSTFGIAPGAEITLETNPETVVSGRMEQFASSGINRASIGMQSAVPRVLAELDRQHRPDRVRPAVEAARDAGLRTSLDLIYGSPTETMDEWRTSLEAAVELDPDHISAYSLIVEPGTKMAAMIARGQLPEPDEDLSAEKYRLLDHVLTGSGYGWYEISNFAKSDADRSLHNLAYWRDWDWWGYGPGAHSHVGRLRWWNVKHPLAYASRLRERTSPGHQGECLTDQERRTEWVMLAIRTREGVPSSHFPDGVTAGLMADGLLDPAELERGRAVLTLEGRLLADLVTRRLLQW